MDRKEFLITVWKKGLKPVLSAILLIGTIYFCFSFLQNTFNENGIERFITLSIFGLVLFFATISLILLLLSSIISKIYLRIPERARLWIRIGSKLLSYIAPVIFGAVLYRFWQKDWMSASVFIILLLIQSFAKIVEEQKPASDKTQKNETV